MSAKSSSSTKPRKDSTAWTKPYAEFPLSFHPPSCRLYKKIGGKRYYFGYADDWQAALEKFQLQRDDLYAGRIPRATGDGLTIRNLCNRFLTTKTHQLGCGEITNRTFVDYKSTTDRLVSVFGRSRLVDDLACDDFEQLRADIAKSRGPVALGNEVQRIRVVFKYAYDAGLIDKPIRYGPTFKRPSKKVMRMHRNKNGKRMFEAGELQQLIDAASPQLRAMILLAANCALGNNDVGLLTFSDLDLVEGWIDFPRPRTGIQRRCPLWPVTVEALKAAIAQRPESKGNTNTDLVFVTKFGQSWSKGTSTNPVSAEFRKLCQATGLYRKGCGFYAIRHSWRTVADETRDFPAIDLIMGHADDSMADRYRERISDERLLAVVEHVRQWFFRER